jgi:hypothetical protein
VRPRDPLLDHAAAEIGTEEASFGPADGLAKTGMRGPFPPGEPHKPSGYEDPQRFSHRASLSKNIALRVMIQVGRSRVERREILRGTREGAGEFGHGGERVGLPVSPDPAQKKRLRSGGGQ